MLAVSLLPIASLLSPPSWLPWPGVRAPVAATQLCELLLAGEADGSVLKPLVDQCCDASVAFRPELLGDGALWRATTIVQGEKPRWQRNAELIGFLNNRAGQAYTLDGSGGSVVNYGEVLGRSFYFKAEGTFTPATPGAIRGRACPVDFNVAISSGGFVIGGREFTSSAISGPGYLRCRYLDENLRVFESPKASPDKWEDAGLVVVQVKDSLFSDPVVGKL